MSAKVIFVGIILFIAGLAIGAIGSYLVSLGPLSSMQSQVNRLQNDNTQLQAQITILQNEKSSLQAQIEILRKSKIIVQNEKYLVKMAGAFTEKKEAYVTSTYFIPIGRQIKVVLRFWANQQIIGTFDNSKIYVIYVYGGQYVQVGGPLGGQPVFSYHESWDFHNEYNQTYYLSLESLPTELSSQVPLCIRVSFNLLYPRFDDNPAFLIYWELTAYDVYPP